jgi:DNA polymerase III delta prime subunit
MLTIHQPIREKLDYFHQVQKIPHIIFHGPSGSGKRTLLYEFIEKIYNGDKERIKQYTMNINCAHGKGIKFIREDLKFFAKTHIHSNGGDVFKSILLMNADKLTMDAQSALRRCIELFSHNTRFFIVVEDKYKLLKPILSRFCEIYVPEVMVDGQPVNLYQYNVEAVFSKGSEDEKRMEWLEKSIGTLAKKNQKNMDKVDLFKQAAAYYEKGYSGLDIIQLLEDRRLVIDVSEEKRCEWLVAFHKVRKEIRNETLLILFLLHFLFVDREKNLDNLSFM